MKTCRFCKKEFNISNMGNHTRSCSFNPNKKEKKQKQTKEKMLDIFIRKYGEETGKQKYLEYIKKVALTENNFIEKYGEEIGKERWNNYINKQRNRFNSQERSEYFKKIKQEIWYIEKYGEEIGKEKYKQIRKAQDRRSYEYFLNKYKNEEIAKKKYDESCNNARNSMTKMYYSKISQELFKKILKILNDKKEIFFAENNGEIKIENNYFDFKYKNKIIEYNGDYWHANPSLYKEDEIIHGKLVKDIWEEDNKKLKLLREYKYEILVIWDMDYKNNSGKVLLDCLNFLYS